MSLETTLQTLIGWMEVVGVAVFAVSGALEASRRQMDAVGFMLIATVTGIGGGTLRDLFLGQTPVAWISSPDIVIVCAGSALAVFFMAHRLESRFRILLWADAVGLALFCVLGTEKALAAGAPALAAVFLGVISATFGGIARDVLCNEVPLILRREIYATAAAIGGGVYAALISAGVSHSPALLCAFGAGFAVRAAAIIYKFSLPGYKSRPGRGRDAA